MKIYTQPDYDDLIIKHCNSTKIKKSLAWHYKFILSYIYIKQFSDKRYKLGDFILLNSKLAKKLILQTEFKNIIQFFINENILECDYTYVTGEKSLGYRFCEVKLGWKRIKVGDVALNTKLDKAFKHNEDAIAKRDGYNTVLNWSKKLFIDEKEAMDFLNARLKNDLKCWYKEFNKSSKNKEISYIFKIDNFQELVDELFYFKNNNPSFNDSLNTILYKYESHKVSIEMMNDYKFNTIDSVGNRLHYNLTNISSDLRQFLTVSDELLYQVDIKNSQPTFLGLYLLNNERVDKNELKIYLDICKKGKFYEYIAENCCYKGDLSIKAIRAEFKSKIFASIFFGKSYSKLSNWELIFQKSFPTIFKEILLIKKPSYNQLAIILQKEESSFIFDCIYKIEKISSLIPLLTIHDSIVSNEIYISKVKEIMEKSFKEKYNFIPKLGIEKL